MLAVQIDRHGGPDVLTLREVAAPEPATGEVLIRTAASSLNPVDWKTRAWEVGPPLPATLGWDISGRVVASNDPAHKVGAQVIAMSAQIATGRHVGRAGRPARPLARTRSGHCAVGGRGGRSAGRDDRFAGPARHES